MERKIKAYAARGPRGKLEPFEFNPGKLRPEQVEIKVSHCGSCHSDLYMRDNEWRMTVYPFVPGHEAVGEIVAMGEQVKNLKIGDRVGLGWISESDMTCPQGLSGNQNLCQKAEQTIVGRHGAFADRVRCHWSWAVRLPDALDASNAGPLFCGGITVFNSIAQFNVKATERPFALCRRCAGAGFIDDFSADRRAKIGFRYACGRSSGDGQNARILRPTRHRPCYREFQDV